MGWSLFGKSGKDKQRSDAQVPQAQPQAPSEPELNADELMQNLHELKEQRDVLYKKLSQLENKLEKVKKEAVGHIRAGNKKGAEALLPDKRSIESQITAQKNMVNRIDETTATMEMQLMNGQSAAAIKKATAAMKKAQEALQVDNILDALDDARDVMEQMNELNVAMSESLMPQTSELDAEEELDAWMNELEQEANPGSRVQGKSLEEEFGINEGLPDLPQAGHAPILPEAGSNAVNVSNKEVDDELADLEAQFA